jgi:hypothetical protein
MTPKIPVQIIAVFKKLRTKDLIPIEAVYPSDRSKACPDLF